MLEFSLGYAVGPIKMSKLSLTELAEVKRLFNFATRDKNVHIFERLFYNNCLFNSIQYQNGKGKRNSSFCSYRGCNGEEMFGRIQKFVEYPGLRTLVFVKRLTRTQSSVLKSSGPPCQDISESYAQVSLFSRFVIEVLPLTDNAPVTCIQLINMVSICTLVNCLSSSCCYIVKLPNNYEHQ